MVVSEAEGAAAVTDWVRSRGEPVSACVSRRLDVPNAERLVLECLLEEPAQQRGAPDGAGASRGFVSKCYVDDTGARTYAVMHALARELDVDGRMPLLALPAALHYDAQRRCIVQQRVSGTSFRQLVADDQRARWFSLAGAALAELHVLPLAPWSPKTLDDHLRELMRPHPFDLAAALPHHADRIGGVVAEMQGLERYWENEIAAAPLHRDFHLRQLFFGEGRVWLIDWDLFAWGDPALDLGNFLMVLETRAGTFSGACRDAFLDGYFQSRPASLHKRIPLYMALNYLRRACKHYRLQQGGWAADVEHMLAHAERCLADA